MNVRSLPSLVLPVLAIACGPAIEPPEDGTSGTSTGMLPPGSTAGVTTTPPPPPPSLTSSTTTDTTSTTSLDSSDESDEGGFIIDPDVNISCADLDDGAWRTSFCDPWAQDCPEGEKCVPWSPCDSRWTATRCTPIVDDPGEAGDPCAVEGSNTSGVDDCALGTICWGVDPVTLEGECVAMCEGSVEAPQCPTGMSCLSQSDGIVIVCLPDCDPLINDCDPGDACIPSNDPTQDGFVCTPALPGAPAGSPCERFDACAPGLLCLAPEVVGPSCDRRAGCCTPWCDLSAPDPSADCFDPAQECVSWWDGPPPAGHETLGACVVPAP